MSKKKTKKKSYKKLKAWTAEFLKDLLIALITLLVGKLLD